MIPLTNWRKALEKMKAHAQSDQHKVHVKLQWPLKKLRFKDRLYSNFSR